LSGKGFQYTISELNRLYPECWIFSGGKFRVISKIYLGKVAITIKKPVNIIINMLRFIEVLIALSLAGVILVYIIRLYPVIWNIVQDPSNSVENLENLISVNFGLIIGVEFVRMICKPTTGTVVEVLMFAIARFLIVNHSTGAENLMGIISIAILFATKKFLFCDFEDSATEKSESPIMLKIMSVLGFQE